MNCFRHYLRRAQLNARQWRSEHPLQVEKIAALRADLQTLGDFVEDAELVRNQEHRFLVRYGKALLRIGSEFTSGTLAVAEDGARFGMPGQERQFYAAGLVRQQQWPVLWPQGHQR